jgi:hypothetical protein
LERIRIGLWTLNTRDSLVGMGVFGAIRNERSGREEENALKATQENCDSPVSRLEIERS